MNKSQKTRYTNLIKTKSSIVATLNKTNSEITKLTKRLADLSKLKKTQDIKLNISWVKESIKPLKKDLKYYQKRMNLITKAENLLEADNKDKFLVARNIVKISATEHSDYRSCTHFLELRKMRDRHPDCLYSQVVKFYEAGGSNFDGYLSDPNDPTQTYNFTTRKVEFLTVNSNNVDSWILRMTPEYEKWIAQLWLDFEPDGHVEIITSAYRKIPYIAEFGRDQIYRENINNNCVLDGIVKYLSNKTCKKGKSCYNKLMKLYEDYSGGVTENQIIEICEKIKCSVNIIDPIKGINKLLSPSSFNYFKIDFYNTRFNHLEQINHIYNETKELTINDYNTLKEISNYYIESMGKLYTVEGTYKKCTNDFKELNDTWRKEHRLADKFINIDSDEYIMTGSYHMNVHSFFDINMKIDDKPYKEIDAKKAYYNHSNVNINKHYKGVPSGSFINFKCVNYTITDYKECKLIGFYQVKIVKIHQHYELITRMFGFTINSIHTLTTSNIDVLCEFIEFEFLNASVSPKCDVPFNEKTLLCYDNKTGNVCNKNDKDAIRGYCKMYGILLRDVDDAQAVIKPSDGDERYYQLINDSNYEMFKEDNGLIKIFNKNRDKVSYRHIAYTIHGYLMSLMFEQMTKIKVDMIIGVKLDSIVVKKECELIFDNKVFDNKEAKIKAMFSHVKNERDDRFAIDMYFVPMKQQKYIELEFNEMFTPNGEYLTSNVCIFGGAGGTGKTHTILNNFNVKNICYSTGSWNLINGKRNEYEGIIGLSTQKLTGENIDVSGKIAKCERIENKNIKVIVPDEATMNDVSTLLKIVKLYPDKFIFILGDITFDGYAFQCSMNNQIINPSEHKDFQYIKFTKTYRFDNELNAKLEALRQFQYDNRNNQYRNKMMSDYVKKNWATCFKNKDDVKFNNNDFGISAINDFERNDNGLTKYFIDKGTKPQYFIKTTNLYAGLMRGQQLTEKPDHANYEMKLFKTVHAFQGLQCTTDNKIIISITKNFNYELFYTAFSRARRLEQIIILNN